LFESVGNYAKVFFGTNKPLILKSLNALEERLDERMFFRANRKHIINLRWILIRLPANIKINRFRHEQFDRFIQAKADRYLKKLSQSAVL